MIELLNMLSGGFPLIIVLLSVTSSSKLTSQAISTQKDVATTPVSNKLLSTTESYILSTTESNKLSTTESSKLSTFQSSQQLSTTESSKLSTTESSKLSTTKSSKLSTTESSNLSTTESSKLSTTESSKLSTTESSKLSTTESSKLSTTESSKLSTTESSKQSITKSNNQLTSKSNYASTIKQSSGDLVTYYVTAQYSANSDYQSSTNSDYQSSTNSDYQSSTNSDYQSSAKSDYPSSANSDKVPSQSENTEKDSLSKQSASDDMFVNTSTIPKGPTQGRKVSIKVPGNNDAATPLLKTLTTTITATTKTPTTSRRLTTNKGTTTITPTTNALTTAMKPTTETITTTMKPTTETITTTMKPTTKIATTTMKPTKISTTTNISTTLSEKMTLLSGFISKENSKHTPAQIYENTATKTLGSDTSNPSSTVPTISTSMHTSTPKQNEMSMSKGQIGHRGHDSMDQVYPGSNGSGVTDRVNKSLWVESQSVYNGRDTNQTEKDLSIKQTTASVLKELPIENAQDKTTIESILPLKKTTDSILQHTDLPFIKQTDLPFKKSTDMVVKSTLSILPNKKITNTILTDKTSEMKSSTVTVSSTDKSEDKLNTQKILTALVDKTLPLKIVTKTPAIELTTLLSTTEIVPFYLEQNSYKDDDSLENDKDTNIETQEIVTDKDKTVTFDPPPFPPPPPTNIITIVTSNIATDEPVNPDDEVKIEDSLIDNDDGDNLDIEKDFVKRPTLPNDSDEIVNVKTTEAIKQGTVTEFPQIEKITNNYVSLNPDNGINSDDDDSDHKKVSAAILPNMVKSTSKPFITTVKDYLTMNILKTKIPIKQTEKIVTHIFTGEDVVQTTTKKSVIIPENGHDDSLYRHTTRSIHKQVTDPLKDVDMPIGKELVDNKKTTFKVDTASTSPAFAKISTSSIHSVSTTDSVLNSQPSIIPGVDNDIDILDNDKSSPLQPQSTVNPGNNNVMFSTMSYPKTTTSSRVIITAGSSGKTALPILTKPAVTTKIIAKPIKTTTQMPMTTTVSEVTRTDMMKLSTKTIDMSINAIDDNSTAHTPLVKPTPLINKVTTISKQNLTLESTTLSSTKPITNRNVVNSTSISPSLSTILISTNKTSDQIYTSTIKSISTKSSFDEPKTSKTLYKTTPKLSVTSTKSSFIKSTTLKPPSHIDNSIPNTNLPFYITLMFKMSWSDFCPLTEELQLLLAQLILEHKHKNVDFAQVVLHITYDCDEKSKISGRVKRDMKQLLQKIVIDNERIRKWSQTGLIFKKMKAIKKRLRRNIKRLYIETYVTNKKGQYDWTLTQDMADSLEVSMVNGKLIKDTTLKLVGYKFHGDRRHGNSDSGTIGSVRESSPSDVHSEGVLTAGVIAGIVLSAVVVSCVLSLLVIQFILRSRRKRTVKTMHYAYDNHGRLSVESLPESWQMMTISGSGGERYAYINPAMVRDDKDFTTHPMTYIQLANFVHDTEAIDDEFLMIPTHTIPTLADLPLGAETKNRYANVIPVPATRVLLQGDQENETYINANYIKGYLGTTRTYIAAQAPMENTCAAFWQMVWEQNVEVVVMLTGLEENGVPKCEEYWPNTDVQGSLPRVYGNMEVKYQVRRVKAEWIQTTLLIRPLGEKQCREVLHYWLTSWPVTGLPDFKVIIKFLLEIRQYTEHSTGPVVVHCSPGTGRTGTLLAIDIGMISYVDTLSVDVLNSVYKMRQDRSGMVQTRQQYRFIYKVLYEYAKMLHQPSTRRSTSSSIASSTNT